MPSAVIELSEKRTAFSPGDRLSGQVSWQSDVPPKSAELRLVWTTDGRGISDFDVVQTIPFAAPQALETRPFSLTLPDAPYSFSGALITLSWTLELELKPGDLTHSVGIVVAPGGTPILLPRVTSI